MSTKIRYKLKSFCLYCPAEDQIIDRLFWVGSLAFCISTLFFSFSGTHQKQIQLFKMLFLKWEHGQKSKTQPQHHIVKNFDGKRKGHNHIVKQIACPPTLARDIITRYWITFDWLIPYLGVTFFFLGLTMWKRGEKSTLWSVNQCCWRYILFFFLKNYTVGIWGLYL